MIPRTFRECCLEVIKKIQITILYKVLVFIRKQNEIRVKAPKLQKNKKTLAFLDIPITET